MVEGELYMGEKYIEYMRNQILKLLEEPRRLEEISEKLCVSKASCFRTLAELIEQDKVMQISLGNRGTYYIIKKKAISDNVSDLNATIVKETVVAKDNYENLKKKVEKIDTNVNGLYANIISIMSIFVAIFALIAVNANIAFELTEQNMQGVFCGIIGVNLLVVVCMIILLVVVRIIIIKPLLGKKEKHKKND